MMYLNVTINDRVNLKVSVISEAQLTEIVRQVSTMSSETEQNTLSTQLRTWEAMASQMTAESWASESVYNNVETYVSNGDGTFTITAENSYSSLGYAFIAADKAGEIKRIQVSDPVESIPLNPDGSTGTPIVTYDGNTGLFHYGIPVGEKGAPGHGIYPQGEATVAEINAFTADPAAGDSWVMVDTGLITYGSKDVTVAPDDWITWGAEGYFSNLGAIQGPQGPIGPQGPRGNSATVDVGSTSTGAEGTDAEVVNSGTISDAIFDFTIPRGVAGETGDQGDQGIQGANGNAATLNAGTTTTGAEGTDAEVVNSGTTSAAVFDFTIPRGDTGVQGATGNTGPASIVPGPEGPEGDIGPQGAVGDTGPAGPASTVPGPAGDTGPQGEVGPEGAASTVPGPEGPASTVPGPTGADGQAGTAATVDAGLTTTGAEGTAAAVSNSGSTSAAVFDFTIPRGDTGVQGPKGDPAQVVTPQGGVTVAELNALVSDPGVGFGWWMEDAGTITYGDPDTAVVVDDIVVWVEEGYFFNAGPLVAGNAWSNITGVTVDGSFPAENDDLARQGASYNRAEQDITDNAQDAVINGKEDDLGVASTAGYVLSDNGAGVRTWIVPQSGPSGADGLGWTDGSYEAATGIVTFTSDDGLGFVTEDLRGSDGSDGATGAPGADGAQGIPGIDGEDGAPGAEGDPGTPGSDGAQGIPGIDGEDGAPGAEGDPGTPGSAGTAATIIVGTVTTGVPGSSVVISDIDPDPSAATFDFTIPRGDTGSAGSDGSDGPTGADGPTGPEGPTVVSTDVANTATLGVDGFLYVPLPTPGAIGAAPAVHTHSISDVTDLQTTLNGKEPANANIQGHIVAVDNPHSVTAAQAGALALTGGTITADLTIAGDANGLILTNADGVDAAFFKNSVTEETIDLYVFDPVGTNLGRAFKIDKNTGKLDFPVTCPSTSIAPTGADLTNKIYVDALNLALRDLLVVKGIITQAESDSLGGS